MGDHAPISQNTGGARAWPIHRRVRSDPATLPECRADRYDRQFRRSLERATLRSTHDLILRCQRSPRRMLQLAQPFERTHASFEAASRRLRTRQAGEAKGKRFQPIDHAPRGSGQDSPLRFSKIMLWCLRSVRRGRRSAAHNTRQAWLMRGRRGGERRSLKRENGQKEKNTPRGPRKPLKRLVSGKEIKVNSKENPRTFQTIPRIFQGISREIKGFPRNAKTSRFSRRAGDPAAKVP
jgi:hypothetical protein